MDGTYGHKRSVSVRSDGYLTPWRGVFRVACVGCVCVCVCVSGWVCVCVCSVGVYACVRESKIALMTPIFFFSFLYCIICYTYNI